MKVDFRMYKFLTELPRSVKRAIVFFADLFLLEISLYAAFALRFGSLVPFYNSAVDWVLFVLLPLAYVPLVLVLRLPNIKLDAFDDSASMRIGLFAVALSLAAMVLSYAFQLGTPRSVPLIFGSVFFVAATSLRLFARLLLQMLRGGSANSIPVAIYGAGAAGIQLASALRRSHEIRPVVFVDDNPALHGLLVSGLQVKSPAVLGDLAAKEKIRRVILAIPSVSSHRRSIMLKNMSELPLEVQALPSYVDLLMGAKDTLRAVSADELLGREKVDLDTLEIEKSYAGHVVMVTGAGGSIGSELCRQLIGCNPVKIVLFEQSEFGLYEIDRELRLMAGSAGVEIVARLGSVIDEPRVREVIESEGVKVILHAAAYKHVPIVEENEIEGARNNVIGTQVVSDAAANLGVERFILISTDKAVRPSNIMGATKRMAEMVVQDLQAREKQTILSMVRFGNVLGSSGSVIPLFQKQIESGGPVTVTHPEVTRFFMTIPEAARLVLLAGAYSEGGDMFVLDMGEPVKIIDVARRMVALSGRTVKDAENPDGDLEIVITGLRPGEKLYEELLIDDKNLRATPHPKILRAEEEQLSQAEVARMLKDLRAALSAADRESLRRLVATWVTGYHRR